LRGQHAVPLPHHEALPEPQPQQGSLQLLQPQDCSQESPQPHGESQPQLLSQQPLLQPTQGQIGTWFSQQQ
jgi:hypothetical protein